MEHVIIGSTNPVKIEIIETCFAQVFPDVEATFTGVPAPSGVADQPASEEETYRGAHNRLAYILEHHPEGTWWAALEGGNEERDYGLVNFGFVALRKKGCNVTGISKTAELVIPLSVAKAVRAGQELAKADDAFFGVTDSGKKMGAVGLLTEGLVTRLHLFQQPTIIALMQIKHAEWFSA